ncbi:DUF883 family protein [Halotalea alkalilenta]|uniref:DUF883 family protein n=1 Tax=Halotalea alkalilenta TaxID=376489 RepID=UPI0005BBEC6B|nr:DUF883 family protein [Halotalea alkalilenta]
MAGKKDIKIDADRTREQLEQDLRDLSDTVEKFLKSSAEDTSEHMTQLRAEAGSTLEEIKQRLASYGEDFKHRLQAGGDELRERSRDAIDCADTYVHENPWRGIGIAAAAGVFVGLLLGRR